MRVGFGISPSRAGATGMGVYEAQLLQHLPALPEPLEITVIQTGETGSGAGRGWEHPSREIASRPDWWPPSFDTARFRNSAVRRAVEIAEGRLFQPTFELVDVSPLARFRLDSSIAAELDVCHWPVDGFLKVPGPAHVVTIHDTIPIVHPEWFTPGHARRWARLLRRAARHAGRIIVDSDATRLDVMQHLDVSPDRIDVVPLAAAEIFRPVEAVTRRKILDRFGLQDQGYVIYVGAIEPRKNLVRLARAFKMARDETGCPARLALAGGQGWLYEDIQAEIHRLGLGDALIMLGPVAETDLPALLSGSLGLAYVSLYEGFGLPQLEGMACGIPVIASKTSAMPEVLNDAGVLVDPCDEEQIAAALTLLMTDPVARENLSRRGLARSAMFSWTLTAWRTAASYRIAASS